MMSTPVQCGIIIATIFALRISLLLLFFGRNFFLFATRIIGTKCRFCVVKKSQLIVLLWIAFSRGKYRFKYPENVCILFKTISICDMFIRFVDYLWIYWMDSIIMRIRCHIQAYWWNVLYMFNSLFEFNIIFRL